MRGSRSAFNSCIRGKGIPNAKAHGSVGHLYKHAWRLILNGIALQTQSRWPGRNSCPTAVAARHALQTCTSHSNTPTQKHNHFLRPSPNERTCMGWHERHASLRRGSRGTLRPEALNLEAWNIMLRDFELERDRKEARAARRGARCRVSPFTFPRDGDEAETLWPRHRWRPGGKDGAAAEDVTPPPSWKEGDGATPSFPYIPEILLASLRPSRGQHTRNRGSRASEKTPP
ncbi:hypothetical protein LSM04_006687 [Trypanosoma melophagium]|uniref:uncharacterized protein n=1 Tax=Trypanosoma melophagium TaxID=715481 RepID=UPI00351A48B4|nr:hypothetical protein LSM04_006687 [Trypanosoma melophagium]